MAIANIFSKLFSKKEENKEPTLIDRINSSMKLLIQKAGNLNDSFAEEKETLMNISLLTSNFTESKEIVSAKMEQGILGNITAVSAACDTALSGKDTADVKKAVLALKTAVSQRKAIENR